MKRLAMLERLAYRFAFLCLLVAAARFGWTLSHLATKKVDFRVEVLTGAQVTGPPPVVDLSKSLSMQMQTPESIQSAIAVAVGTANPSGSAFAQPIGTQRSSITGYLSVQVGPPRSELRVNGRFLGHTPFVGQIACEKGETVKLDVLPPRGMPKHYEIPCTGGEMRLDEEPPAR